MTVLLFLTQILSKIGQREMKKDYSNHKNGPITQKLHNFFSIFYTFHSFTLKLAPNDYAKFQIICEVYI